jgi:uncharacterized protein YgbK (DUF1537 family)
MPDHRAPRRVVILDDDPTGTQTSSDVEVLLEASEENAEWFAESGERSCFVLTNSRSLSRAEAVSTVRQMSQIVGGALDRQGIPHVFLLRGDSTLRGHVFAEIDAIARKGSVTLFVPAFPEGGRITLDGVHFLRTSEGVIPVARTEYASDPEFGYSSTKVVDWVAEVGDGRPAVSLPYQALRSSGPELVARALIDASSGGVVVPDAENRGDLIIIRDGLLAAEAERPVQVRSAATFASLYAGLESRMVSSPQVSDADGPVLVVCGSFTTGATSQIGRVIETFQPPVLEVAVSAVANSDPDEVGHRVAVEARRQLENEDLLVLMTPRELQLTENNIETGARLMTALTTAVGRVAGHVRAVVAKGGITSAEVAKRGFGIRRARVVGQIDVGIPLWELEPRRGRVIPYVVVPGNVGDEEAILRILQRLGV